MAKKAKQARKDSGRGPRTRRVLFLESEMDKAHIAEVLKNTQSFYYYGHSSGLGSPGTVDWSPLVLAESEESLPKKPEAELLIPPGARLREWLGLVFSQRSCTRILDPVLADWQHEWLEAHKRGDLRLARWAQIRGIIALVSAVLMQLPLSVVRWLWEAWKRTKAGG